MEWNDDKALAVKSSTKSAGGCWCIFVPLSETEGVKFYPSAVMRDAARNLQARAHAVNLGPAVGATCEMPFLKSWARPSKWSTWEHEDKQEAYPIVYGYVTEIVDTDVSNLSGEDYVKFLDTCGDNGISTNDLECKSNIGFRADGVLVRFDFDPVHYLG